jgi:pimeloyl-ACP methyl ester carboxylesterase
MHDHEPSLRAADRRDQLALADGRVLAWREWGPVHGAPVLLCTGAGMSGALGLDAAAVDALGVRLLAVDRPGLGASSPDPNKSFASFAADIAALTGQRGLAGLRVVGVSQGAPFALALAAHGLARAVAVASGQDELAHPELVRLLPAEVARMIDAAAADPSRFEAEVAATATAEWLWSMIQAMSAPRDRAVYELPTFAALYQQSLREGFAQGPAGYARDLSLALRRWPFAVEDIAVPVDLWFGRHDTSPVHSPDHGALLSRRLRLARRTVDEHAGGAIAWTHSRELLAALLAAG